jgi:hypothetical protein
MMPMPDSVLLAAGFSRADCVQTDTLNKPIKRAETFFKNMAQPLRKTQAHKKIKLFNLIKF